jgi:hypothetical protein
MLRWLIGRRLTAFEKRFGYDASYMRELLAADRGAFSAFYRASRMTYHRRDVPLESNVRSCHSPPGTPSMYTVPGTAGAGRPDTVSCR